MPPGELLHFREMRAKKHISELFCLDVQLLSEIAPIDPKALPGRNAAISIEMQGGARRYLDGIVTRFAMHGQDHRHYAYKARLSPWLRPASVIAKASPSIHSSGEHLELVCGKARIVLKSDGGIYLQGAHIELQGEGAINGDAGAIQWNCGASQSAPGAPQPASQSNAPGAPAAPGGAGTPSLPAPIGINGPI